jgi:hypothetical protein
MARNANEIEFGVELETLCPPNMVSANRIRIGGYHGGIEINPYSPEVPRGWKAERDGSIHSTRNSTRDYLPCEIVSPILKGEDGIRQVVQVCRWLTANGFLPNYTCGIHVTVGLENGFACDVKAVERVIYQAAFHERCLFASTGTTTRETGRLQGWNPCAPIGQTWGPFFASNNVRRVSDLAAIGGTYLGSLRRYRSLNLNNLTSGRAPVIEFRCFAGSTSDVKVLAHIFTCLALVQKGEMTKKRPAWNAGEVTSASLAHRKSGAGLTALTRFFYNTGWTKGRCKVNGRAFTFGHFDANGEGVEVPSLKEIKKEMGRLARKYDKRCKAEGLHHPAPETPPAPTN